MLVNPSLPRVYNPTNGTAPEMPWRTSTNGFGVVMLSEWCARDDGTAPEMLWHTSAKGFEVVMISEW